MKNNTMFLFNSAMTHLTRHLDGEVGIQISDIVSDDTPISNQTNLLMIIQDVPRGRVDKPMVITQKNLHQKLGRRISSQYLQAIQDSLDVGVARVSVLRIIDDDETDVSEILYNNTIRYDGKYQHNN